MARTIADLYKVRPPYGYAWLHAVIWALLLLLPFIAGSAGSHYSIGSLPAGFLVATGFIHMGLFYGNASLLYPKLYTARWWFVYILCAILLLASIIGLKFYMLLHWFAHPYPDANNWRMIIAPTGVTFLASIVYRTITDKTRAEKDKQEMKEAAMAGELKFLRSQVNPHFIFNVLTGMVTMARKKSDQLEAALLMLSGLMRYMLYDTVKNKITLQQEAEYLENYIALQRMRFGADARIESNISVPATNLGIEPMILIPFVENAFKHGADPSGEPWIEVRLQLLEDRLYFAVKNTYTDEPAVTKDDNSGIGIENVSTRLRLLYKNKYSLDIRKKPEFFTVQLMLELV